MSDLVIDVKNEDGSITTEFTSYFGPKDTSLKTSEIWMNDKEYSHIIIMDPDGWDRKDYEYSFNVEEITKKEFNKRLMHSTVQFNKGK